jgi:iron complex transport system substrate-binding protein
MKHTTTVLFSLLILTPVILGIQSLTITDDMGNTHILGIPPKRIISLAPNITEILFALGLENRIIGVTRYCNHPEKARSKNQIGGMVDPDLEKIIALHPDLVIAFRGNPLRLIQRLRNLGMPVFVLESGTTLESVFTLIQKIGRVTQRDKAAQKLIDRLTRDSDDIKSRLSNVRKMPEVFINLHGRGLWTTGKHTFMNDMVREAKGINIAGEAPRAWFSYNREELIHKNPDHILILAKSETDFLDVKTWFAQEAHLESIRAVQTGNMSYLNEDIATRPGPRIFEAFSQIAHLLHPSAFEEDNEDED